MTHDDGTGGARALDFDHDILAEVNWSALSYDAGATVTLDDPGATRARRRVDYAAEGLAADGTTPAMTLGSKLNQRVEVERLA